MSAGGTPALKSSRAYCFEDELAAAGHSGDGILVLDEEVASAAWVKRFGSGNHSYFKLPDDSWVDRAQWCRVGRYIEAYNADDSESIQELLRSCVDWPPQTVLLFCSDQWSMFRVSWGLFLRFWSCFLCSDDDCPILLPEEDEVPNALLFNGAEIIKLVGPRK